MLGSLRGEVTKNLLIQNHHHNIIWKITKNIAIFAVEKE